MGGWSDIWIGEEDVDWSESEVWVGDGSEGGTDTAGSDSVTGTDSVAAVSIPDSGMVSSGGWLIVVCCCCWYSGSSPE